MSGLVAVFVDGDNLPAAFAGRIFQAASAYGTVVLARVYGNEKALGDWGGQSCFEFVYCGSGKNASDIKIAIDVTEYVLTRGVQTVLLGSSDADFTHLARFVRARHIHVVGMGEDKTRSELRAACSEFRVVAKTQPKARAAVPKLSEMDIKVVDLLADAGPHGMRITQLGGLMYQRHNTRISSRPEKTWRAYLSKHAALFDLDPRGPDARVRLRAGAKA